jgi:hypothetical protein
MSWLPPLRYWFVQNIVSISSLAHFAGVVSRQKHATPSRFFSFEDKANPNQPHSFRLEEADEAHHSLEHEHHSAKEHEHTAEWSDEFHFKDDVEHGWRQAQEEEVLSLSGSSSAAQRLFGVPVAPHAPEEEDAAVEHEYDWDTHHNHRHSHPIDGHDFDPDVELVCV